MNAYLRKEIRLLLPSFGIALLMALSVWLIPPDSNQGQSRWMWLIIFPMLLCPALVVMIALDSFGREISCYTFANLLSQPISRTRIWWTKTSLLAMALVIVFGVWWVSFRMHLPAYFSSNPKDMDDMFMTATLLVVTVFSGGLCSVLFFRQVGAAFWFTLIVPAALAMLTVYLTEKLGGATQTERNITVVLVTYGAAAFIWARKLFLRAQDVQWTGGNIALPAWFKLPRMFAPSVKLAGHRPRRALLVKELQLHQSQFVIAGVLALSHLSMIVVRHSYTDLKAAWVLEFVALQFWTLWVVMPVLIGCVAVAEERKLGTLEGQLCLPARRRTQFVIKFGVALGLATFFGFVMPLLFEGGEILPDFSNQFESGSIYSDGSFTYGEIVKLLTWINPVLPFLPLFVIAIAFFAIAFYASTLGRNTLQAIGPSILGVIIVWALILGAMYIEEVVGYLLWQGGLIYLIGVPVLMVTLACLTYWNFKRVLVSWQVWRRNIFTLLGALAFVIAVTTATYQRAWEFLTPTEPMHGPARFAKGGLARFEASNSKVITELPDGRTRFDTFMPYTSGFWSMLTHGYQLQHLANRSRIEEGTNWLGVVDCVFDQAWLRTDGSLWVPEQPQPMIFSNTDAPAPSPLVRKGQDNDWKRIVGMGGLILLLKSDGSLWQLGDKPGKGWQTNWHGLIGFEPKRLGTNSDWVDLLSIQQQPCLRRQDGSLWSTQPNASGKTSAEPMIVADWLKLYPASHLGDGKWRSVGWVSVPRVGGLLVGVHESGEFRAVADWGPISAKKSSFILTAKQGRIGNQTNWVAMAGDLDGVVTLRADGTLWRWRFQDDPLRNPGSTGATQLGVNSDWVGVVGYYNGVLALSADGGIWFWLIEDSVAKYLYSNSEAIFRPLLRLSRKPQLVGNVFAKME